METPPPKLFGQQELDMLFRLSIGDTSQEAADALGMTLYQFKHRLSGVMSGLVAKNATHAVAIAIRNRLI